MMTQKIYSLNGHIIRRSLTTLLLIIYSKPLASKISKMNNSISLIKYKNGFIIRPHGTLHATIAAGKRIQIAITKVYKTSTQRFQSIIPIYVNLNEWQLNEIVGHAIRGIPILRYTLKEFIAKKAAIRENRNKFYIDISFKKLSDIAEKERLRCLVARDGKDFVMIKSNVPEARKLTKHSKRRVQIAIPKEILNEDELRLLQNKNWLEISLKFNLSSFGLGVTDFYTVKEEKELVSSLLDGGIIVKPKNYRDPYDIYLKDYCTCIEVHNSNPDIANLNLRHGIKSGQVRLRILEAQYLVNKLNLKYAFVIVNELWKENKHVTDLIINIDKRVCILFTDFKDNWTKKIINEIGRTLNIKMTRH